jgi:hypothetical protein
MLFAVASSPNASDPYQVSMQYQKMKCKIIILLRIFFYDRNVGRCSVDAYQVHTVLYYSSGSLLVHTSQYHVVQNYVCHTNTTTPLAQKAVLREESSGTEET